MKSRIILLIMSLLFFGCSLPFSQEKNIPNVEVVVPTHEEIGLRKWILSPSGDKLIYASGVEDTTYLLDLGKKEKRDLNFCEPAIWLDNNNILCEKTGNSTVILVNDDFDRVPLIKMESSAILDLGELLQTATAIYKYEGNYNSSPFISKPNSFYLLNKIRQKSYQVVAENVDKVLEGYDFQIIPKGRVTSRKEQYSPDTKYYFLIHEKYTGQGSIIFLTIYDAIIKEKLTEYEHTGGRLEVGGWAADSSGVYFQPVRGGGVVSPLHPGAILKLKVPE